jgi:thymidylate synthase (FAD)
MKEQMKLIKQYYETESFDPISIYKKIEGAGRTCYKSEEAITEDSYKKFIPMLMGKNHESVLEHATISVRLITSRSVSHELVRHRIGVAYSQESQRYCNYSKDKFDHHITFILPCWLNSDLDWDEYGFVDHESIAKEKLNLPSTEICWLNNMLRSEIDYMDLISNGWKPEQARDVLPNTTKTEIFITANVREWIHILDLRCSPAAHPQMRDLMFPVLKEFNDKLPLIFGGLAKKYLTERE